MAAADWVAAIVRRVAKVHCCSTTMFTPFVLSTLRALTALLRPTPAEFAVMVTHRDRGRGT